MAKENPKNPVKSDGVIKQTVSDKKALADIKIRRNTAKN